MRKESFLLSLTTPCQPDRTNSILLCFVTPCEVPNTRNGRPMLLEKKILPRQEVSSYKLQQLHFTSTHQTIVRDSLSLILNHAAGSDG